MYILRYCNTIKTLCLIYFLDFPALMVSGGHGTETARKTRFYTFSGEVTSCTIPDLPHDRYHHTMDHNIVCGGGATVDTQQTCLKLTSGG